MKKLFTPGPLNTSVQVRQAMNYDIGSRTAETVTLTSDIHHKLKVIAKCGTDYECILLQGSGTFAIEAMLTTFINSDEKILILSNGAYGDRMVEICHIHSISYEVIRSSHLEPINLESVKLLLSRDQEITHIAVVQFETGIGVVNDVDALTKLAEIYNCGILVDAMSSFGALTIDYTNSALTAVTSSANKCMHGVPGVGFVIVRRRELFKQRMKRTLSLDLKEQWQGFQKNGQWRFTPPTHVLLAFRQAIDEFLAEGGTQARYDRYTSLATCLINGLALLDIEPIVEAAYRAPMITTFVSNHQGLDIDALYNKLYAKDMVIYPSPFSDLKSFRVGCIGEIEMHDINELIDIIRKHQIL